MTEAKNPWTFKDEPWIISEVKSALISIYAVFKESKTQFYQSIQGLNNFKQAKANYVSALEAYYSVLIAGYLKYLEENPQINLTEEDYASLLYARLDNLDDDKLLKMGYHLDKWNFTKGHFKLQNQSMEYDSPEAQLQHENEI